MSDATIRVQALDGGWETLGSDRTRGIVGETLELESNPWGNSAGHFSVKALTGSERSDLLPFTPVDVEIDGVLSWAGFIFERPTSANEYTVNCRGWQYHLDDDMYDRVYVHTRLGDYRDQRTFLGANLALFTQTGSVQTDGGSIVIGWPNGAVLPNNGRVGVMLDLGPASTVRRAVMAWESTNNSAAVTCFITSSDTENVGVGADDFASFAMNTGTSGTTAGTNSTGRRYIHILLNLGVGTTFTADLHLRIKSLKLFRDTAYESGNASILEADEVIRDALTLAPLLNQTTALIADGSFAIPEYLTGGQITPRQAMEQANVYENNQLRVAGADRKTLEYRAKPTAPLFEVGDWSGAQFTDASVSGEEIYDKVIVEGTGPDGSPLVRTRTQTGTLNQRRGQTRAKTIQVRTAITDAVGDRFGDLWLDEHEKAPFSGTLQITGAAAVRKVQGGESVPPHVLLLHTGEKIRLSNRVDPDTGAWARDGRIAGVTYRHADRSATVAIDDRPQDFERLLEKYGALVGTT